eukprot:TRINITY_DN473_c0_g2_i2.p2 TRINITY_DN473_c0_g2~~TRINITY_DN473_c0_g2_i2.p2  ORF type:complete len:111 (-),score=16.89 TRINITY_DN473_c0_g2_i2:151-483(-)
MSIFTRTTRLNLFCTMGVGLGGLGFYQTMASNNSMDGKGAGKGAGKEKETKEERKERKEGMTEEREREREEELNMVCGFRIRGIGQEEGRVFRYFDCFCFGYVREKEIMR